MTRTQAALIRDARVCNATKGAGQDERLAAGAGSDCERMPAIIKDAPEQAHEES